MVKVRGTLKTVTGQPLVSSLSITLTDYGVNPPSTLYLPAKVVVVPDLTGQFEVELWANQSSSHPCTYRVETPQGSSFLISIPGGVLGPLDIGALVVTKPDLREDTNILHRLAKLEATGGGSGGGTGGGEPLTFGSGLTGGTYNGNEPVTVEVASTIARVNSPALVNPTSNHPVAGDNSTRLATTGWSSDASNITSGILNPARLPTNLAATTAQRLATPRSIFGVPFDGTADIPQFTLGAGLIAPTASSLNLDFNVVASAGDPRFTNSREWIAPTVTQAEAETGTDPLRRAWSAQRVRQAIVAWWASFENTIARLNSPSFTGSPTAPTPPDGDSSTRLSTTAWSSNATHLTQGTIPVARIPTLNQDTTGTATNATKLTTPRNILGLPFDGTADLPINPGNGLVVDSGILGIDPLDSRMTDAREWTAPTVTQAEAEAGSSTTRKAWTPLRVRQAITAWWASIELGIARLDSPNFTGTPSAPTPSAADSTTRLATTAWASNASNLTLGTIPTDRIPTLNQNTTGNATTATRLATARTIMGVAFDGTVNIAPTLTSGLNYPATGSLGLDFTVVARLASPAFTGTPTAPTPTAGDNTTKLATTAFSSNAANLTSGTIPAARVPVLNQNTTGTASNVTGVVAEANGGTGLTTKSWVDLSTNQASISGQKTFLSGIRTGSATIGSATLSPGGTVNAGYVEIFKGNGTTRLGYIGFDNTNLTYVAENGATHKFTGGRAEFTGVGSNPSSTVTGISLFSNNVNTVYNSYISSTAAVNYKIYDICNESGNFSIRRINDAYNGILGNLITHDTANTFSLGNSTTQSSTTHGGMTVYGSKNSYAGIHFGSSWGNQVLMVHGSSGINGMWSAQQAINGWNWCYDNGAFIVNNYGANTEGTNICLMKSLGGLPGYPTARFPTLKTDFSTLYFSAGGAYSASMSSTGVFTSISDKNKKTVVEPIQGISVLEKVKRLPVNRYHFKDETPRITHIGTFAQEFYAEFGCGGDQDMVDDDSPTTPDKMISISDVSGVCLAAIKALIDEVELLKAKTHD